MLNSKLGASGKLGVVKNPGPGLSWKLRNTLRWIFIVGWFINKLAYLFTKITGIPTVVACLKGKVIKADGRIIDYGVLGYRVVTDDGVEFLVDDWVGDATDITNMKYHACGTDNTAENATDSALGAESTTVTDRATGTMSEGASANIVRSIGTCAFTGTASIVEHGLFSVVTESAGVLWDRTVFTSIGVDNGDSIQFTYECTINSGS